MIMEEITFDMRNAKHPIFSFSRDTGVRSQEVRKGTLLNSGERLENSNAYLEIIFCDVNKFNFSKNAGTISTAIFS